MNEKIEVGDGHAGKRTYIEHIFCQTVERCNRLEADLIRARRQNEELLRQINALQGFQPLLLLPWCQV